MKLPDKTIEYPDYNFDQTMHFTGIREFYHNGYLDVKYRYVMNQLNGKQEIYYSHGKLFYELYYNSDILDFVVKNIFDDDGLLKFRIMVKNNIIQLL